MKVNHDPLVVTMDAHCYRELLALACLGAGHFNGHLKSARRIDRHVRRFNTDRMEQHQQKLLRIRTVRHEARLQAKAIARSLQGKRAFFDTGGGYLRAIRVVEVLKTDKTLLRCERVEPPLSGHKLIEYHITPSCIIEEPHIGYFLLIRAGRNRGLYTTMKEEF
jgi:hypothetical protein